MHTVKWLQGRPGAGSLGLALAVGAGFSLFDGQPVFAQSTSESTQIQQLQNKLEERDAVINDLRQRVEQLERQSGKAPAKAATAGKKPPPTAAVPPAVPPPVQPMQAAPPPPAQAGAKPAPSAKPAPGSFEVSEEAAERALERTLNQTGALLLPSGRAQVEPFFSYQRNETNNIASLVPIGNNLLTLQNRRVRSNEYTTGAAARLGLPFDSQFELSVPYRIVHQSIDTTEQGTPKDRSSTGSTLGDLSVGVAKTVIHESGWRPDLIARVTWDTNTGEKKDNNVPLGYGYNELTGSLTALKRQDPLAFVGTFGYQKSFEDNNFKPGNQYILSIGTVLAASPETSLNLALQQNFVRRAEAHGNSIPNSDYVQSVFYIGATSILGRSASLSLSGGIGLTDESPDYIVNVSTVIGFNAF